MKQALIRIFSLMLCIGVLLSVCVSAGALGENLPYTYFYDVYGWETTSPDAYQVWDRIDVTEFGIDGLKNAEGLFVRNDDIYICDTGNNRLVQLKISADSVTFTREIKSGESWSLKGPEDVFVTEEGMLYIADTGNGRVLILDAKGELLFQITAPTDSPVFDNTWEFKPQKLAITAGGRLYVQASGVNKGIMEFNPEGVFEGYMGASPVRFDFEDYIWKLLSTDAQKAQMADFVPTEYNNVAVDHEGFLFVTTSVFEAMNVKSAEPVRRLNLKGKNILVGDAVYGDYSWDGVTGPSRLIDLTVLDNGIYYVLDSTRNRVFAYDMQEGYQLYAFGGIGTREGYFQSPKAIEHWGKSLLILDSVTGYLTIMDQTEYGALIDKAITAYASGDYTAANEAWEQVISRNGHYFIAYDGVGKIRLRNGDYITALDYLKYAENEDYYSKAWKLYRKDWVEQNLIWFVVGIGAVAVITSVAKVIRREKEALSDYEELHHLKH